MGVVVVVHLSVCVCVCVCVCCCTQVGTLGFSVLKYPFEIRSFNNQSTPSNSTAVVRHGTWGLQPSQVTAMGLSPSRILVTISPPMPPVFQTYKLLCFTDSGYTSSLFAPIIVPAADIDTTTKVAKHMVRRVSLHPWCPA